MWETVETVRDRGIVVAKSSLTRTMIQITQLCPVGGPWWLMGQIDDKTSIWRYQSFHLNNKTAEVSIGYTNFNSSVTVALDFSDKTFVCTLGK